MEIADGAPTDKMSGGMAFREKVFCKGAAWVLDEGEEKKKATPKGSHTK